MRKLWYLKVYVSVVLILTICALTACGSSDTQPYVAPPDEAYIQNIAQLNTLEEVEGISIRPGPKWH